MVIEVGKIICTVIFTTLKVKAKVLKTKTAKTFVTKL